jgi:hypothetical protein
MWLAQVGADLGIGGRSPVDVPALNAYGDEAMRRQDASTRAIGRCRRYFDGPTAGPRRD